MDTQRKLLVISRHGKKCDPEADRISDSSAQDVYRNTGGAIRPYVLEQGITLDHAALVRSNRVRTKQTGKAILAGAFGYEPIPATAQEFGDLVIPIDTIVDERFDYNTLQLNESLFKRVGNVGYLKQWFANPEATQLEGVDITPFREVIGRTGSGLVDIFGNLFEKGKSLVLTVSHSPILESAIVSAINSARRTPIMDVDEIGGAFKEEEFATLGVDYHPRSGTYGDAILQRNGQLYAVDVNDLKNAFSEN